MRWGPWLWGPSRSMGWNLFVFPIVDLTFWNTGKASYLSYLKRVDLLSSKYYCLGLIYNPIKIQKECIEDLSFCIKSIPKHSSLKKVACFLSADRPVFTRSGIVSKLLGLLGWKRTSRVFRFLSHFTNIFRTKPFVDAFPSTGKEKEVQGKKLYVSENRKFHNTDVKYQFKIRCIHLCCGTFV